MQNILIFLLYIYLIKYIVLKEASIFFSRESCELKDVSPYLDLVPGLCLLAALGSDVLILSLDLGHDGVHVQVTSVVHLHDDGGVFDLALHLAEFLVLK